MRNPTADPSHHAQPGSATASRAPQTPAVPTLDQITFIDAQSGFIGGEGLIYSTMDQGKRWQISYRGQSTIYSFHFLDARIGWAIGTHALLRTTNGGRSWTTVSKTEPPLSQVHFLTPRIGYAIRRTDGIPNLYSGNKGLLVTRDGGRVWTPVPHMQTVDSMTFASSAVGWAATPTELLYTQNGGQTWSIVHHFKLGSTSIRFAGKGAIWLLALNGAVAGHGSYVLYRMTNRTMKVVAENPYFHVHSPYSKGVPDANLTGWSSHGNTAWLITSSPIGNGPYGWSYSADGGKSWSYRGTIRGAYEYSRNRIEPLSIDFLIPAVGWMVSNHAGHGELWNSDNTGITWHRVTLNDQYLSRRK